MTVHSGVFSCGKIVSVVLHLRLFLSSLTLYTLCYPVRTELFRACLAAWFFRVLASLCVSSAASILFSVYASMYRHTQLFQKEPFTKDLYQVIREQATISGAFLTRVMLQTHNLPFQTVLEVSGYIQWFIKTT